MKEVRNRREKKINIIRSINKSLPEFRQTDLEVRYLIKQSRQQKMKSWILVKVDCQLR